MKRPITPAAPTIDQVARNLRDKNIAKVQRAGQFGSRNLLGGVYARLRPRVSA